jgi:uncharacterized protein YaiL (DUF2058 family)
MSNSLRDQLKGLGFKEPAKPDIKPAAKPAQAAAQRHAQRPDQRQDQRLGQRPAKRAASGPAGRAPGAAGKPAQHRQHAGGGAGRSPPASKREDIDLAKAYAIRAQREKDERIEAERLKQEDARLRREAKAKLDVFLKDKALNAAKADFVRHFDYGGKIKRIHVTAEQLKALNVGALGVVQQQGRYLLVDAATLQEVEAIFAQAVALKVDPNAPAAEDPYADPQYQVPDDLSW